jgi:hypothetical protein
MIDIGTYAAAAARWPCCASYTLALAQADCRGGASTG